MTVAGSEFLRVFVSFSARDEVVADFVRLFWHRLAQQQLQVFRYETFRDEIPAGAQIDDACKAEIDRAQRCFVVISTASLRSPWTRSEVAHAISLRRDNFILPIVVEVRPPWPEPYDRLQAVKAFMRVDSLAVPDRAELAEEIDKAILAFCGDHGLQYFPPSSDLPRLPLRQRLYQEVWGTKPLARSRKAQTIEELFNICQAFLGAYGQGNLASADLEIRQLIARVEREFPDTRLYYAKIVKALVDRDVASLSEDGLRRVQGELMNLANSSNPWVDANVHALIGNIYIDLGEPRRAAECFEIAEKLLSNPDPALIHNRVLAAVLEGNLESLEALEPALARFMQGTTVSTERDYYRLRLLHALVCTARGRGRAAIDHLAELPHVEESDFDLIIQCIDSVLRLAWLHADQRLATRLYEFLESAEDVAERSSRPSWVSLIHRRAWLATDLGRMREAVVAMECILERQEFASSLKLLLDACMIFGAAGALERAASCHARARAIKNSAGQNPPLRQTEFDYYRGLAFWLEGSEELARHYYEEGAGGPGFGRWYAEAYPWVNRAALRKARET